MIDPLVGLEGIEIGGDLCDTVYCGASCVYGTHFVFTVFSVIPNAKLRLSSSSSVIILRLRLSLGQTHLWVVHPEKKLK